jgi:hypothetical protein
VNTTRENAAAEYLDAVRAALADLPDDEVAEIADDVAEHLEQVTAELGGDASTAALEQRLGTPEQYAAELRAAAGFPERGSRTRRAASPMRLLRFLVTWLGRGGAAVGVVGLLLMLADGPPLMVPYLLGCAVGVAALGAWVIARRRYCDPKTALRELPDARRLEGGLVSLRARPWGAATVDFAVSLRPAWWLLRAWVATQLLMLALGSQSAFPAPRSPVAVAVLAGAVVASVWLGRRSVRIALSGWRQLGQLAGNTVLAVLAPAVILLATYGDDYLQLWYEEAVYEPSYYGFHHEDGSPIVNLFPYDQNGRLLEGVRIYDQDGRPVENVEVWDWAECMDLGGYYPGGPLGNVFPRPAVIYREDGFGRCVDPANASPFGPAMPGTAPADGTEPVEPEADEVEPGLEDDK